MIVVYTPLRCSDLLFVYSQYLLFISIFVGSLTLMFCLCQETHQRPIGEASASNITFEVLSALNYGANLMVIYHGNFSLCHGNE